MSMLYNVLQAISPRRRARPGAAWRLFRQLVIAALCLSWTWAARAGVSWEADYVLRIWETGDGLPQNSATSITQTADGYLWFGTFNGLVRFDGLHFKVFDPTNSGLARGAIRAVHGDSRGRLWILTVEQELFLMEHGVISPVAFANGEVPDCYGAQPVVETPEGRVFTTTRLGVAEWIAGRFEDASARLDIPKPGPGNVLALSSGKLWLASGRQIGVLENNRFHSRFDLDRIQAARVHSMTASAGGSLWVHYYSDRSAYVVRLAPEVMTGTLSRVITPDLEAVFWCLFEDRAGTLWGGTTGNGLLIKPNDGAARNLGKAHGLSQEQVRSVFEDREGNLWLGTDGGGLIRARRRVFQTYGSAAGLLDEVVYSVAAAGNHLDVGTSTSGIYRLNPQTGLATRYPVSAGYIRPISRDPSGRLWFGTLGSGLYAEHGASWKRVPLPPADDNQTALCFLQDAAGALWVGGPFGLGTLRGTNVALHPTGLRPGDRAPAVRALAEGPPGTLWVATHEDGLFRVRDAEVRQFTGRDGLPSHRLTSLLAQDNGVVWVGTADQGLARFADNRFTAFGVDNGLPARTICSILDDRAGDLWIGSHRGILRVDRTELESFSAGTNPGIRYTLYGRDDGLVSPECSSGAQPAACRTEDGRLWFATIKGVAVVDPSRENVVCDPPPLHIEAVWADRRALALPPHDPVHAAIQASDRIPSITLPANYRVLEIQFAGLSLAAPEKVRFRHKVEGFDTDWVRTQHGRVALYPKLPTGDYLFVLNAALADGPWDSPGQSLRLRVLPAWWETPWFRSLLALAVLGSIAAVHQWRARRRTAELALLAARQQSISEERARISRDMHDGLGAKLTQVSLLARALEQPAAELPHARETANRISSLSQDILASMAEVVWAVDPQQDNLESLAQFMTSFGQEHLALAGIKCRIDLPPEFPALRLPPAWRHHVLMIYKETLQNILKHAAASLVTIRLTIHDATLHLEFQDDGVGLAANSAPRHGHGHGLDNTRRRLEALRGEMTLHSQPGQGTRWRFTLPLPANMP